MAHFLDQYADRANELLHDAIGGTLCFRQEIIEVPGLLVGLLVTYEGQMDDSRQVRDNLSWDEFLARMSQVKPDWGHFDRGVMEQYAESATAPCIGGWEGKTIYFIKGGRRPVDWAPALADRDVLALLTTAWKELGTLIQYEVERLRELVPVGRDITPSLK